MDQLPSSIEAYLEEAGFTGTEILILRRLMEGEPLTIRQLGAKTGKSTGVLDQAMKKLIKKDIIRRTIVNEAPRYSLDSLEAVVEWMQEDMEQKREMLLRRHQNFESFVTSLEGGSKRPDIEYFEDESGIKQAYIKLLNGPGEILHYLPVQYKEEEDPLRDFRVQYFRERQRRKMFSRVLAHDTSLGRRYQSRDAFEYRKTILVPEDEYPFTFEKIITGDRIACIDHEAKTACVIRYPELADVEKTLFEAIWRQAQQKAAGLPTDVLSVAKASAVPERIAMRTETMSQVREFLLSPKSLMAFGVCAVLAAAVTYMLYWQNLELNKVRIQERVKSIAATAALQFDASDINQIWTPEDVRKPEYAKLVHHLNRIRRENEGVKYAYIMRSTGEAGVHTFVADADALNPYVVRDVDENGVIDEVDHLSPPGEIYKEDTRGEFFSFEETKAYDFGSDQWGTFITGTAPILNADGKSVAVIGVDVEADQLQELVFASFWPAASFGGFFLLFVFLRFAAFNQAFLREYMNLFRARSAMIFVIFGLLLSLGCSVWLYSNLVNERIESARNKIFTIAKTGVLQFSAQELESLRSLQDTQRPEYEGVMRKLSEIRKKNENILYVYLIRPRANTTTFEFIADADAFGANLQEGDDINSDGQINDADEVGYPGLPYDVSHIEILRERTYHTPVVTKVPYTDKWGAVFTGYAPIRDASDVVIALLAVDVNADGVYMPTLNVFVPIFLYIAVLIGIILYRKPEIFQTWLMNVQLKNVRFIVYTFLFIIMVVYWVLFGLRVYALHLKQEEMGKRLMAIVATAASEFDPEDLRKLRFARDMKTSEYQRVFAKLNEIRDTSPEVLWIYILRPTQEENLWEFVADADANFFLDSADDYNTDRIISVDEENVWPGQRYYYDWTVFKEALNSPSYSKHPETDQWGTYITGAAPIKDKGVTKAIIGIDFELKSI